MNFQVVLETNGWKPALQRQASWSRLNVGCNGSKRQLQGKVHHDGLI